MGGVDYSAETRTDASEVTTESTVETSTVETATEDTVETTEEI